MRITDPVALKQFKRVVKINSLLTIIENIGFLIFGKWDYTVLLGSLWGLLLACFFFYKICVSVPQILNMENPNMASRHAVTSQTQRLFVTGAGIFVAFKVSFINAMAAIIPLFFTRVAIVLINLIYKEE